MRFNYLMLVPVIIVTAILFAAGYALLEKQRAREAGLDPDALPSTLVGAPVPDISLPALGDLPAFDSAAMTEPGVKLVNYWASWCAPCRAEHPNLQALADEGVPVYGINYKDDTAKALAFLEELGNPYVAVVADTSGRAGFDWGLYGVPETFVIDAEGIVRLRFAGPITKSLLDKKIRPAIEAAR